MTFKSESRLQEHPPTFRRAGGYIQYLDQHCRHIRLSCLNAGQLSWKVTTIHIDFSTGLPFGLRLTCLVSDSTNFQQQNLARFARENERPRSMRAYHKCQRPRYGSRRRFHVCLRRETEAYSSDGASVKCFYRRLSIKGTSQLCTNRKHL